MEQTGLKREKRNPQENPQAFPQSFPKLWKFLAWLIGSIMLYILAEVFYRGQ